MDCSLDTSLIPSYPAKSDFSTPTWHSHNGHFLVTHFNTEAVLKKKRTSDGWELFSISQVIIRLKGGPLTKKSKKAWNGKGSIAIVHLESATE